MTYRFAFAVTGLLALGGVLAAGCSPTVAAKEPEVVKDTGGIDAELLELARNDHIALLEKCIEHYEAEGITNYTCTFVKRERIRGSLGQEQKMDVKFLAEPFSVAITWTQNAPLADKVLYVADKWEDENGNSQMLVRPKGGLARLLAGESLLKDPAGPDAMKNALRPVTEFGFRNTLQALLDVYVLAQERGEMEQSFEGISEVDGRKCLTLIRILPKDEDYPARKTVTCIDIERLLPLKVLGDGWQTNADGEHILLANYEYHDVKLNPGLTPEDFTPQANDMAPPKQ